MNIRSQDLQELLLRFSGHRINEKELSSYHQFSLQLFTDPKKISNPRIEFTSQIEITEIYKNYEDHYKNKISYPTSFTAFFKWILLKAMYSTPFNWLYINNQWYQFDNLLLFVATRTSDEREQTGLFIYDVVDSSWEDFCKKHAAASQNLHAIKEETEFELILYPISYQIERLHIPRMTSYRTTIKSLDNESHRPSIVFSDPYLSENKLYLPIHFSISHATLMPKLAEDFIKKLIVFGKKKPEELKVEYKHLLLEKSQFTLSRAKL